MWISVKSSAAKSLGHVHSCLDTVQHPKINKRVHATAISFVILSTVVLQFFMTIFRLVFTALWLPIYYLCVHHVILEGCFLLHWKKGWIAGQVLLRNHPTFSKSWKCPKLHFTAFIKKTTKIIWYSTPISTFKALSKWHDTRPIDKWKMQLNISIYILGWVEFLCIF